MKELLISLIGEYEPIEVLNGLYIDIPFLIAGFLVIGVICMIVRGVFMLCKRG